MHVGLLFLEFNSAFTQWHYSADNYEFSGTENKNLIEKTDVFM